MTGPFYTRTRTFADNITPPAVDQETLNAYEAAHQAASDRVVALESGTLDARYGMAIHAIGSSGSALTLDAAAPEGNVKTITLTANCAITLTGAVAGKVATLELVFTQGGAGGFTVAWPAAARWDQGIIPTIAPAVGAVTRLVLASYNGGTTWLGVPAGRAFA